METVNNNYTWLPNETSRPNSYKLHEPQGIVIHAMLERIANKPSLQWLAEERGLSIHAGINSEGTIEIGQADDRKAYHAGVSLWQGHAGLNHCYLGVELLVPMLKIKGTNPYAEFIKVLDNSEWVSEEAINALVKLIGYWVKKYPSIKLENIIMHSQCSGKEVRGKSYKHDPGKLFPYDKLIRRLSVEVY